MVGGRSTSVFAVDSVVATETDIFSLEQELGRVKRKGNRKVSESLGDEYDGSEERLDSDSIRNGEVFSWHETLLPLILCLLLNSGNIITLKQIHTIAQFGTPVRGKNLWELHFRPYR